MWVDGMPQLRQRQMSGSAKRMSATAPAPARVTLWQDAEPHHSVAVHRLPLIATATLSALLLFAVQPLAGKWLLPWFGGAPAVWATCLLFFQLAVLIGYGWAAWLLTRSVRTQILGQLVVVGLALMTMPIIPDSAWANAHLPPALAVLVVLARELGLPAVALAATSPLVQGWASRIAPGSDPYRLAAVSSAGSLIALVAYPLLIEPALSRSAQSTAFAIGLGGYALLLTWSATRVKALAPLMQRAPETVTAPTERWLWLVLPAIGTLLLTAITEVVCQEIAPVPFLWVAPLALYLISWILVYAGSWGYPRTFALGLLVAANLTIAMIQVWPEAPLLLLIIVYLLALFSGCWCVHGETARRRPDPSQLGLFHFSTAVGGVLGTAAVVFLAPLLFVSHLEHRVGLIVAAILTVYAARRSSARFMSGWLVAAAAVVVVAAMAVVPRVVRLSGENMLAMQRSFFGVLAVRELDGEDARLARRELHHGVTTHGRQMTDPSARRRPTTYYGATSGVGLALQRLTFANRRIGLIGLGAGTLCTYARPGDHFRFYEIDPLVETMARQWFTFITDCRGTVDIRIGDGRQLLAAERDPPADLLVLDAFSSDAIPVHLLTHEAFSLYRERITERGVIAVHISNRHLDLRPVIQAAALRQQWPCLIIADEPDEEDRALCEPSLWVLTGPDPTLSTDPLLVNRRLKTEFPPHVVFWSDERADVLSVLR